MKPGQEPMAPASLAFPDEQCGRASGMREVAQRTREGSAW
jgi:hypothetical protein